MLVPASVAIHHDRSLRPPTYPHHRLQQQLVGWWFDPAGTTTKQDLGTYKTATEFIEEERQKMSSAGNMAYEQLKEAVQQKTSFEGARLRKATDKLFRMLVDGDPGLKELEPSEEGIFFHINLT